MKRASITEAKNRLSALIDHVRQGESVIIEDRGVPVAQLNPVADRVAGADQDRVTRLVRQGILRPLPFNEPDRLVVLHTIRQDGDRYDDALSAPNFMSLAEEESRVFANLAGFVDTDRTLTGIGEARRLDGTRARHDLRSRPLTETGRDCEPDGTVRAVGFPGESQRL